MNIKKKLYMCVNKYLLSHFGFRLYCNLSFAIQSIFFIIIVHLNKIIIFHYFIYM
jgi:hypothetical protein